MGDNSYKLVKLYKVKAITPITIDRHLCIVLAIFLLSGQISFEDVSSKDLSSSNAVYALRCTGSYYQDIRDISKVYLPRLLECVSAMKVLSAANVISICVNFSLLICNAV